MSFVRAMKNYEASRSMFEGVLKDRHRPWTHRYHAVVRLEEIAELETEILLNQIGIKTNDRRLHRPRTRS